MMMILSFNIVLKDAGGELRKERRGKGKRREEWKLRRGEERKGEEREIEDFAFAEVGVCNVQGSFDK